MRKKIISAILFSSLVLAAQAQTTILQGYDYAKAEAPQGDEWQSPEKHALNKEQPRTTFAHFGNVESARKVLPENSEYWQSLDGTWKFNWVPTPEERPKNFFETGFDASAWDDIPVPSSWNIAGLQKDGTQKYGTPIYVNQPVIFYHEVKVDDWKKGVMRTPTNTNWTTYKHRNEVGSYLREFTVPDNWKGRNVFISFDGVDSFFYLWINGHYVGFSKNSRNRAEFNITPYLNKKGSNRVAVEVYRSSDGSFLEAQDMFRLPGIFRTVALYSTPTTYIRDLIVLPALNSYNDGALKIAAEVSNADNKKMKGWHIDYSLYANKLYSDENSPIEEGTVSSIPFFATKDKSFYWFTTINVGSPNKWSAEAPYRYTLVAELKDSKGRTVETVSTYTGFRQVEIRDTKADEDEFGLAGRYFYVNNKPVKLKGVNRHESSPALGHAVTRELMEKEVMLMKRGNINHVRTSHYPDAPYFYYLCDKYGIYLEDEANIESHEYYYGEASLSHPVEWQAAHVARVMEMVHSDYNHPSIVIWSLGNEAGPGDNFVAAYRALKEVDKSRPVQYERNNSIVDMGSNQYPDIPWVQEAVKGKYGIKYPFHISEYAHSMGNAAGNLVDYWNAIESTNFFCGGAIWDWIDQSLYNYTPDGKRYLAYGGDFGDTPNDGQFVMNGIVFGDMEPKPQYYEVKKVYQYVGIKAIDITKGEVEIFNKNYFTDLQDYEAEWSLWENGTQVESGELGGIARIAPRSKKRVTIAYDYSKLNPASEYFIKIQLKQKADMPWAKRGFVQAEEQLFVKAAGERPTIMETSTGRGELTLDLTQPTIAKVKGQLTDGCFFVDFNTETGTIHALGYDDRTYINGGNGPKLEPFRAFVNNDNWFYSQWFQAGLHNLRHKVVLKNIFATDEGTIVAAFTIESQAPNAARILGGTSSGKNRIEELTERPFGENDMKFTSTQVWTVYPDGSIELQADITSNQPNFVLPRLGYVMKLPGGYDRFSYYGRGPIENYPDRETGQFIELYKTTTRQQVANFPKPQDVGNHEDARWCAIADKKGNGLQFISGSTFSVQALPYSATEMTLAGHIHQLPESSSTYLHLDAGTTGLGGTSCGQAPPLKKDRITAGNHHISFIIRPIVASTNLIKNAQVSPSGSAAVSVSRDFEGNITVATNQADAQLMYQVGKGKAKTYTTPFPFREGGTITAWDKATPQLKTVLTFPKSENIKTEVVYASSEERSADNYAKYLTDNDPSTFWHTTYGVTQAKYPHIVDLDAGTMQNMKGLTYMPRQDGGANGTIKEYQVQVSSDGKSWSEPIQKGSFERGTATKTVYFKAPVKARYLRFTALSAQDGNDHASGAELTILAE